MRPSNSILMISPLFLRMTVLVMAFALSHAVHAQVTGSILEQSTSDILTSEGITFSVPKGWKSKDNVAARELSLMAPVLGNYPPMIWLMLKRDTLDLSSAEAMRQLSDRVRKLPGADKIELFEVERDAGGTFPMVSWEDLMEGEPYTHWSTILRLKGNGRVLISASCRSSAKEAHRTELLKFLGSVKGDRS